MVTELRNLPSGAIRADEYHKFWWAAVLIIMLGPYALVGIMFNYINNREERWDIKMSAIQLQIGTVMDSLQEYRNEQTRAIARGDETVKNLYRDMEEIRRRGRSIQ